MFKHFRHAAAAFAWAALCTTGVAQAQGLVNGGFELPGFVFTGTTDNYRDLFNGDSTTLAGWTVSDDGIGFVPYVFHSTRYPVHSGSYAVTLNQGSGIGTTVPLVAGQAYRLTTWLQNAALNYPPSPLEVTVQGDRISVKRMPAAAMTAPDARSRRGVTGRGRGHNGVHGPRSTSGCRRPPWLVQNELPGATGSGHPGEKQLAPNSDQATLKA